MPKPDKRRYVGLGVHKKFLQFAIIDQDGQLLQEGKVSMDRGALQRFAKTLLQPSDEVALESTTNAWAVADLLEPYVAKVVVSNALATKGRAPARRGIGHGARSLAASARSGRSVPEPAARRDEGSRTAVAPATAHWYARPARAGRGCPPACARTRPPARNRFPRWPRLLPAASHGLPEGRTAVPLPTAAAALLPAAIARKNQPCRPPPGGTGPPPLRRRSSGSATRPRVRPKARAPRKRRQKCPPRDEKRPARRGMDNGAHSFSPLRPPAEAAASPPLGGSGPPPRRLRPGARRRVRPPPPLSSGASSPDHPARALRIPALGRIRGRLLPPVLRPASGGQNRALQERADSDPARRRVERESCQVRRKCRTNLWGAAALCRL